MVVQEIQLGTEVKSLNIRAIFTKKVPFSAVRRGVAESLGAPRVRLVRPFTFYSRAGTIVAEEYARLTMILGGREYSLDFLVSDELVNHVEQVLKEKGDAVVGKDDIDRLKLVVLE